MYPQTFSEYLWILMMIALSSGFIYLLWILLITSLDIFVNNRLVEINKQKGNLWLAVEDLYEATDDLKERTWDYDDNRKQVRKLTKDLSELEEYVLNDDDEDSKSIFAKAVINKSKYY